MTIDEYTARVIALFRSGNATDEQWQAMAEAVLYCSEASEDTSAPSMDVIDAAAEAKETA